MPDRFLHEPYWSRMDPARHPFDREAAPDEVRAMYLAVSEAEAEQGAEADPDAFPRAVVERYGHWAAWWPAEAEGEGDSEDQGAILRDLPPAGTDLDGQVRRYTAGLLQWRDWLEELAGLYAGFAPPDGADDEEVRRCRERGVAPLVAKVAERARAGSADTWVHSCGHPLAWFLESTGVPARYAEDFADRVLDRYFQDWVAPDEVAVARVAAAVRDYVPGE
ncbi:hypothetical protein [Streptomyces sp. NBC_01497]|uniref:hypothetical protein n=1 Tax=Streptomyces sp. NBC_01497 TaxID=2903885 RepID=UPI002E362CEB|nr:hypothetical protein [Streptomyces sp. NBC_01497]